MEQVIREPRPGRVTIRTEIVKDLAGLARLREEWNALYDRAFNAAPPLHFDWIEAWLQVYGPQYMAGDEGLRIICCRRERQLVGILPLYLRRARRVAEGGTHLVFISTGERIEDETCPDYMDLLCLREVKEQCAAAAWSVVSEQLVSEYDRVELCDMADHSPLVNWARERGADFDMEISPRGVCPISDLEGGMDAYLGRISHKTRAQCRRLMRAAAEANVEFEVAASPSEATVFYEEMIHLHRQRWHMVGLTGCFDSEPFSRFHRILCEKWVPTKMAVLSRIRLNGTTIGVKYGFRCGTKFDFYQSGVLMGDTSVIKSPGTASLLLLMRYLIGEGITTFDFLRGSAQYKQRLATGAQPLVQVRRVLWTWRTGVGLAASLSSRAVRKATRIVRRTPAARPMPQET